jgi:predicted RNA binding protein YcfA (HicA-like mRNA interferase family)
VSQHFPVCNAHDVVRVLRRNGFVLLAQRGSHQKWRHPDGRQVIVPMHGSKPIPIGTLKNIIAGSRLDVELFR